MIGAKRQKRLLIFSSKDSSFMYTLTFLLTKMSPSYEFESAFVLPLVGRRPTLHQYLSEHWDAIIIDARPGQEGITQIFYHELTPEQRRRIIVNGHPDNGLFSAVLWEYPRVVMNELDTVLSALEAIFHR